eukprot:5625846-Prymnesium_polylepis.1
MLQAAWQPDLLKPAKAWTADPVSRYKNGALLDTMRQVAPTLQPSHPSPDHVRADHVRTDHVHADHMRADHVRTPRRTTWPPPRHVITSASRSTRASPRSGSSRARARCPDGLPT